jgi:poly(3-hydroxybutyrate) depolymerase
MLALLLAACGKNESLPLTEAPRFNIDESRITVSGISSGAYMAGQFHVAHSALVNGAALLAGGPYYCAEASIQKGLGPCIKGGDTGMDGLVAYAVAAAAASSIDSLNNLNDDRIWLFHGTQDVAVSHEVVVDAQKFYERVALQVTASLVDDVEVVHGMPTLDKGVACNELASPFLNACNYDAAGVLLNALYESLNERVQATGKLLQVSQPGAKGAVMLDTAFLYVPASCTAQESCGLHIAFHGCKQSSEMVGDAFARDAGYNEWAESNRLLVLYPQVASSKLAPMNPLGCWDWWGYTGEDYATKSGAQIVLVMATIRSLDAASE